MANEIIILQIMLIALGMVIFSSFLNRLFGLKLSDMKELQEKGFNLQERMKNAQSLGDMQMMRELQLESAQVMKTMMKKQFIPMCLRCIIFIGIFGVLGIIYAPYDDFWFITYFLFSLLFSFSAMGIKYAYKKVTHKEDEKKIMSQELMGILSPTQGGTGKMFQISRPNQFNNNTEENIPSENADSWKDRLEKTDSWKDRLS